ncbi:MAG: hypothetical protein JSU58_04455, partial [Dehalococcoidales bacterium]
PHLAGDDWLIEKFQKAREIVSPNTPASELYLALLAYRLNRDETEELIRRLGLRKLQTRTLRDDSLLKGRLNKLSKPGIRPSEIYELLHGLHHTALTAASIADSQETRETIILYLDSLRYVRPALTGKDLEKMGIQSGPHMKEILRKLLRARLDGQVTDKQGEIEMIEKLTRQ